MFRKSLFAFLLTTTFLVYAQNSNQLSAGLLYFDYEEFDPTGFSLNHETGFIPGISTTLNRKQHAFQFSFHHGTVDYDGFTQSLIPHQTNTDETLLKLNYRYYIPYNDIIDQNQFYFGMSYQYWLRDIRANNGVNGLEETYTWFTAETGIQYIITSGSDYSILLNLGLLHTFNGKITINLEDYGFGSPQLELGDKPGFKGNLKLQINTSENQIIEFGIDYSYWEFGKSNSKTLFNGFYTLPIYEPRSESNHTILYIGLNQWF